MAETKTRRGYQLTDSTILSAVKCRRHKHYWRFFALHFEPPKNDNQELMVGFGSLETPIDQDRRIWYNPVCLKTSELPKLQFIIEKLIALYAAVKAFNTNSFCIPWIIELLKKLGINAQQIAEESAEYLRQIKNTSKVS